jgi:hypothetical protein
MSAQHEVPDGFVRAIPRTINAIGDALAGEKRTEFLSEVLAAEQGTRLDEVMTRWWTIAMLARVPGIEKSRADALAGRNLVPLSELIEDTE